MLYCDELKIGMGTSLEVNRSTVSGVADDDWTPVTAVTSSGVGSSSATLTSTTKSELVPGTAAFSMAIAVNSL